jgi:SWI/SNF-related matrix-associated actin-dependent regulator 1 of chromatin subfamily A
MNINKMSKTLDIPLKLNMYPYQCQGTSYIIDEKKVIVGDAPGLGKTIQAIAAVVKMQAFPCLIICPSSLKLNWQREIHMWTDYKAMILSNQNQHSWEMFTDPSKNLFGVDSMTHFFIVNYESLSKYFVKNINKPKHRKFKLSDVEFNKNITLFKSIVIDEIHRVKEPATLQAKLTKGISSGKEIIIGLTGTPVVNKARDLASILAIIDKINYFGGYDQFLNKYCQGWDGADNLIELNQKLTEHCFYRREKSDVLKDLPAKVRHIVPCEITTQKEYNDALKDLKDYLRKYKQASDSEIARSMRGEVMVRIGILKNISARGKLNDVIDYVKDIIESGEKIVLFVHLREVGNYLKQMFPSAMTVLGSDDNKARQLNIDKFQKDPETQVIICSIKAAGVGITLTASSRVAFVELPWHPADTEQCEDRCHRIGQKDSVQCTYFLGKNTIDNWIYSVINGKRQLSNDITGARNDVKENIMSSVIELLMNNLQ